MPGHPCGFSDKIFLSPYRTFRIWSTGYRYKTCVRSHLHSYIVAILRPLNYTKVFDYIISEERNTIILGIRIFTCITPARFGLYNCHSHKTLHSYNGYDIKNSVSDSIKVYFRDPFWPQFCQSCPSRYQVIKHSFKTNLFTPKMTIKFKKINISVIKIISPITNKSIVCNFSSFFKKEQLITINS